jgi:hypothetical protein
MTFSNLATSICVYPNKILVEAKLIVLSTHRKAPVSWLNFPVVIKMTSNRGNKSTESLNLFSEPVVFVHDIKLSRPLRGPFQ